MKCFKDAAQHYALQGLAVFPLRPNDKRPLTKNGCKDATTDVLQVNTWWTRWPNANIGIATGRKSGGLVVIDVDIDDDKGEDGGAYLRKYERQNGELPDTARSITGRGGMHILYRTDKEVKNSANPNVGIDIRGEGGYIVAPPSVHPNGNCYEWEYEPDDGIATADDAVFRFIESVKSSGGVKNAENINKGGRNDAVYRYAASLHAKQTEPEALRRMVQDWNQSHCKPPLSIAEVNKTVDSILKKPAGLSEAAKQAAKRKKSDPADVFEALCNYYGACTVDGAPAVIVDGRYKVGFAEVDKAIYQIEPRASLTTIKEVRHRLLTLAEAKKQSDDRYIGYLNGVLDVETMQLLDWNDSFIIANVVPHNYYPDAECDAVDQVLLRMACGDDAIILNLHEVMGACVTRSNAHGQMVVLLNETGANGKSTYIKMLRFLLGAENCTSIDIALLGKRFQAAGLVGKLADLADDIGSGFIDGSDSGNLKKCITGEPIYTDVKGSNGFVFVPTATIVVSANELPRFGDMSGGMVRRFFPIPFNAKFTRDDPDYNPRIMDALQTPEAGERMALLAAIGAARIRANNGFTDNAASQEMVKSFELDNSTVLQFARDNDVTSEWLDGKTPEKVYSDYRRWCEDAGIRNPLARKRFSHDITRYYRIENVSRKIKTADGTYISRRVFKVPQLNRGKEK